jgi:predicted ATP-grasp superfamily ATP-dependent carboligase
VLSESVKLDPRLKQYAERLLEAVNWHGAAMVEFRINPEGKAYLMEVNTRFWGSLQLAIDSGVDFPLLLAQVELGQATPMVTEYRIGQRLRWFLGDLDGLYLYLRSRYSLRQKCWRVMQFCTPRLLRCRHETNRWNDFAPARHEFRLYLKHFFGG